MIAEIIAFVSSIAFFIIPFAFIFGGYRAFRSYSVTNRTISQTAFYVENKPYVKADNFFNYIAQQVATRKIKGLTSHTTVLKETTVFQGSRKYLVVKRGDVIFYVSTFPLGNAQIYSYWLVEPFAFWRRIWSGTPIFGKIIMTIFFPNSLYKMDAAAGLSSIIQADMKAVLDTIVGEDGYRLSGTIQMKELHKTILNS